MQSDVAYPVAFTTFALAMGLGLGVLLSEGSEPNSYHECVYKPLRKLTMGDRQVDALLSACSRAFPPADR
jgi:hypothetical protein